MHIEPVETPSPTEWAYRVWVSPEKVRPGPDTPIPEVTTLREFKWHTEGGVAGIGHYVFTRPRGVRDDGRVGFLFCEPKTEEARRLPYKVETKQKNYAWPMILLQARFAQLRVPNTTNIGGSVVRSPRYRPLVDYIPGVDTGSRFIYQHFFAPSPFKVQQSPTPQPGAVSFVAPDGSMIDFPECLHDDIAIGDLQQITETYNLESGALASDVGLVQGATFPATNFKTWRPFVLSDDQQEHEPTGGQYRLRIIVIPPPLPKRVRKLL